MCQLNLIFDLSMGFPWTKPWNMAFQAAAGAALRVPAERGSTTGGTEAKGAVGGGKTYCWWVVWNMNFIFP